MVIAFGDCLSRKQASSWGKETEEAKWGGVYERGRSRGRVLTAPGLETILGSLQSTFSWPFHLASLIILRSE